MSGREFTPQAMAVRTATILFLFVVIFTGALSGAYLWTKPAIEASAAEEKMKMINEVLPHERYDNALLEDSLTLPPTAALGQEVPSQVFRARQNGQPVAAILEAVAPDGYAGKIRLIIAVQPDGQVAGVRVTQHKETPGLGDYIEPKKDKDKAHPWILQFTQLNYTALTDKDWKVKKDGGRFDYHAGATITPRAIVKAVKKAVQWAASQGDALYAKEGSR